MARGIDGLALGTVAAGSLLVYAGLKGISVPSAIQAMISGHSPSTAAPANQINTAPAAAGSNYVASVTGTPSSQSGWAKQILGLLGVPTTNANVMSLVAWANRESPWNSSPPDGAEYTHNPLNTTLTSSGVIGSVNSVGVKVYDNWTDGNSATVQTLSGYPNILSALSSGKGLCGNPSVASELSTWSGGGYSSVC